MIHTLQLTLGNGSVRSYILPEDGLIQTIKAVQEAMIAGGVIIILPSYVWINCGLVAIAQVTEEGE